MRIRVFTANGDKLTFDLKGYQHYRSRKWNAAKTGIGRYLMCSGKYKDKYFHRSILNISDRSQVVDHINGDSLDNRVENLRICSHSENSFNRKPSTRSKTGFKGVSFKKNMNKYVVQIMTKGCLTVVGYATTALEGAKMYDEAARKLHGEFAYVNLPQRLRK